MFFTDDEITIFEGAIDYLVRRTNLREVDALTVEQADEPDRQILGIENIIGFGFGEKEVGGQARGGPALCAFVVRKVEPSRVDPDLLFEAIVLREIGGDLAAQLPRLGGFIATDVIEVGRPRAFHHERKSYTPRIPGGVCIDDGSGATSTLGTWVTDGSSKYLLTCWHSIDRGQATASTGIYHPKGRTKIATFAASVHPESDWKPGMVTVDAALALADQNTDPGDFLLSIGEIHDVKTMKATLQAVRKSGVATHLTEGTVRNLSGNIKLTLPTGASASVSKNPWLYERQLIIAPDRVSEFSKSGDSGSIVMTNDGYAVGLLVGGGSDAEALMPRSVATPIKEVLDQLRLKLNPRPSKLELICYP